LYLLVTRVRDEADYLPALFQSVLAQTRRPGLWIIVDHGSQDYSPDILESFAKDKDWVKVVHLEATETYGILSHAAPLKFGFEVAVNQAKQLGISYSHLGILDADIVPEPDYFEKLILCMEGSPNLGIIGGRLFKMNGYREILEGSGKTPRGGCRLYRRECYESIGGVMPESAIWDTETDVLAELRGWEITAYTEAKAIHKRATYTRKGIIRGYWRLGKCHYYANNHPLVVFLTSLYFTCISPFIIGSVFLISYIYSWLKKEQQTSNPEIKEYFWNSFQRLRRKAIANLKNLVGGKRNYR